MPSSLVEELSTLDRAIRLQHVDLFSDLETDMLALVASVAKQVRVDADETLFERDSAMEALYVVLDGRIAMHRGEARLFSVGPDETIGNWALFDEQPSVVTAAAEVETWLLRIDREDFFDLLADHSDVSRALFQALFKRARALLKAGLDSGESAS